MYSTEFSGLVATAVTEGLIAITVRLTAFAKATASPPKLHAKAEAGHYVQPDANATLRAIGSV